MASTDTPGSAWPETPTPRPPRVVVPPARASEEDEARLVALQATDERHAAIIQAQQRTFDSLTLRLALLEALPPCLPNDFKEKILRAITSTRFQAMIAALAGTASLYLSGGIDGNAALLAGIGAVVTYTVGRSFTDAAHMKAATPAAPAARADVRIDQGM
ncbi:MAG TPA: hypothetical protein VNM48_10965 [Chloroflexota bacterium]|nr:hypothetical protein [Chloroflexota bacterium]